MPILIVGGSPEAASAATLRAAASGCGAVVAVDRGLDAVRAAGIPCDLFCGDADSLSPASAARLASRPGFAVERYNPHKDETDLALALRAVGERWGEAPIRCTCLSGGSPDHALGVLGRLAVWPGAVELAEDGFAGRILRAGSAWCLSAADLGRRFSFIPLSPAATVSEAGMRWELDRARVPLLSDLGISNVIERADASLTCHEGTVACWCFAENI